MSTRKFMIVALIVFVALATLGCTSESELPSTPEQPETPKATMNPGTYSVVSKGFYGDYNVSVTVTDTAITDITVGEYKETESIGGKAIKMMIEEIIAENTVGVDSVSGATITSAMFRSAVEECLKQANASDTMFAKPTVAAAKDETITTDVLVVGAGASGLSAAVTAAENGAKVTLIEKQDIIGGSTSTSAGIVYAAIDENDYEPMLNYYLERANQNVNKELLQVYIENSLDSIAFLEDAGVQWMMTVPSGTASEPRARFSKDANGLSFIGTVLVDPLEKKAIDLGVKILTGVKATELIQDSAGAITGAKAESKSVNYTFEAGAVILATGGYDASKEMKEKYAPIIADESPLSSKGNTGDGINMGIDIGADTVFKGGTIGFVFVNASLPDSGYSGSAMGAYTYVKPDGTYVMDPVDYPITHTAINESGEEFFYGLSDAAGADSAQRAVDKGFGYKSDTIEELATAAGMDVDKLKVAITKSGKFKEGPYYAVQVRPTTIGSMGGLKINTEGQVLAKADGQPIPGLFAAGEVANGDLYNVEYPASGTSIGMGVTYGRIVGKGAAESALSK